MKSKLFKQAKDDIRNIKLLPEERVNIMTAILAGEGEVKSPYILLLPWFPHQLIPTVALILIIVVGAGTSFAAESAVPGDLLYPVKIKINEPARNVVKLTPEAKAHWEEEKVNRRLKEAEVLASREELDEETRLEIESLVEDHLNIVEEVVAKEEKSRPEHDQQELKKVENRIKDKKQKIHELTPKSESQRSGGNSNISGQNRSPREESKSLQETKEEESRRDAWDNAGKEQKAKKELKRAVDDD